MSFSVGEKVIFNNKESVIVEKIKGHQTNKRNMQSGIMFVGYHSSPCTYILSTGQRVQGNKLKHIK